jgi:hypothetical protein
MASSINFTTEASEMSDDKKTFSKIAMDSQTVTHIENDLGELQKSWTVAHLKEAMPAATPTATPVASTQSSVGAGSSQGQSNENK